MSNKQNLVEIHGVGVTFEWGQITEEDLKNVESGDYDEDDLYDWVSSNSESGISQSLEGLSVFVNGDAIDLSDTIREFKKKEPVVYPSDYKSVRYICLKDFSEGKLYELALEEGFDISKLSFTRYEYTLADTGGVLSFVVPSYGDYDFDFLGGNQQSRQVETFCSPDVALSGGQNPEKNDDKGGEVDDQEKNKWPYV